MVLRLVVFAGSVHWFCTPLLLPPPHCFWLIRPGCQAIFTECPFADYSPRNHVAQLNYWWLQRLHSVLRHPENALFNQPIISKAFMTSVHKETLLYCPCCPWGNTANAGFLSAPGDVLARWENLINAQENSAESPDNLLWFLLRFLWYYIFSLIHSAINLL